MNTSTYITVNKSKIWFSNINTYETGIFTIVLLKKDFEPICISEIRRFVNIKACVKSTMKS